MKAGNAEPGVRRRLAAMFSADVAGFSRLMGGDEEGTLRTLHAHREVMDGLIALYGGRVVTTAGDSVLAEFASVVAAVASAVEVQRQLAERNAGLPADRRLEFRIGINLGDVVVEGEDIYGDGVNVAARLQELAEPGGVSVSGNVYEQVRGKLPLLYEDLGDQRVKNIAEPVRTYRVRPATPARAEASALPDRPSIAVLPFDNMSGDPEQGYFSDGITEDLITELSKISGLFVIARHSAFTYKGRPVTVQQVSRELGVRYVLEGSVRKAGTRVRISAQLVEAGTGGHLWAERYDRNLEDIFAVQDEVTRRIVEALEVKLTKAESECLCRSATANLEAYDTLLRATAQLNQYTREGLATARALFERAIELDPTYACAYAWLARTYLVEWVWGWARSPEEGLGRLLDAAGKAVALDDSLSSGHAMRAWGYLWSKEHEKAIAEAERAVALDPNDSDAHAILAFLLASVGRSEDALRIIERAMALNPHYPVLYLFVLGHAYFVAGRVEEAILALERGVVRNPDHLPSHMYLAALYGLSGREEKAKVAVAEMRRITPGYSMEHVMRINPFKDPAFFERFAEGLRRAGFG